MCIPNMRNELYIHFLNIVLSMFSTSFKSVICLRLVGLLRNLLEYSHFFNFGNIDKYFEVSLKSGIKELLQFLNKSPLKI